MAKPLHCQYCGDPHANIQAIRAHLRTCPERDKPRQTAAAIRQRQEPRLSRVTLDDQDQATGHDGFRENAETIDLLLRTDESFRATLQRCAERLCILRLFQSCRRTGDAGYGAWYDLCLMLLRCRKPIGEMIVSLDLDRTALWKIYQTVLTCRERAVNFYVPSDPDYPIERDEPTVAGPDPESIAFETRFDDLVEKLRQLVVLSRCSA